MNLLVFAHRKEAESFIDHLNFKPMSYHFDGLYTNDENYLLVTGEGYLLSLEKTISVLSSFFEKINLVINIGIAGSLRANIKKGEILNIRTAYAFLNSRPEFKSFTSDNQFNSKIDCITAGERVLNFNDKMKLSPFADIIDRELWGIASASQLLKKSFSAIKYISDELHEEDFCKLVINESELISSKLLAFYQECHIKEKSVLDKNLILNSAIYNHNSLYFTVTQERRLEHLLTQLKHQDFTEIDFLAKQEEMLKLEILPKEKTKRLLENLALEINPINHKISDLLNVEVAKLKKIGINASIDKSLEKNFLYIHSEIRNNADKDSFIRALNTYNFDKIENIFKGEFDV